MNRPVVALSLTCVTCWAVLVTTACDRPDPAALAEEERLAQLALRLDLPEVPALEALQIASRYSDGSYSVGGVQRLRDELMEEEIEVIAIIREKYRCDRDEDQAQHPDTDAEEAADAEPEEGTRRVGCLRPHAYVSDSLRATSRLLVVGFTDEQNRALEEGQRYRFSGRLTRRAPGHLSPEEGLLDLKALEPLPEGFTP